jgi:hypothetical protein
MYKNKQVRRLGVALAAVLAALPASQAYAATSGDTSQLGVTAGSLSFGTAPDVPAMPALTLNGQSQTLTAQMPSWSASDATGSGSGWNVTVQGDSGTDKSAVFKEYCTSATDCGTVGYVTGGKTLSASSLRLSSTGAAFTALNGSTGTAPTHQCASTCNVDSGAAVKIASAAADAGMGNWQGDSYGASSLGLSAPTTVKSLGTGKVYRVDLTWTLSSGP